jgi:hypothetical protein
MGTFTIFRGSDGLYYWNLKAANGERLCHSEGYQSKQAAQNGIAAARKMAPMANLADIT